MYDMLDLLEAAFAKELKSFTFEILATDNSYEVVKLTKAEQHKARWQAQKDAKILEAATKQQRLLTLLAELELTKRALAEEKYQAPKPKKAKAKVSRKVKSLERKAQRQEREIKRLKARIQKLVTVKRVGGLEVVSLED